MKVSLFIPCLNEHFFAETALSMVKILERLGCEVEYVDNQTCCGQPAFNSGYFEEILPIAKKFINLFGDKDCIVAPSGSCVFMVREHYKDLDLPGKLLEPYENLRKKIYEFTEFLVDVLKVEELGGSFAHKVTYHESCHLTRGLGIKGQPRRLISGIRDIEFVEMERPDVCCGFGGTFSYKNKDISIAMVKQKCEYIRASGAEYCVGADASCLMNIQGYLDSNNMNVETIHIADLLAESLGI